MKNLEQCEFTIVGTGLMGASLAMALHGKVKALHGVDANPGARRIAAPHFDSMGTTIDFSALDVLILAAPVRAILSLLEIAKTEARPGTLIIDLGSVKKPIVEAMNTLPAHVLAVGGHPMCGREVSGPAAADGSLYNGCTFVLCETQRSTPASFIFAQQLVRASGGIPILMDATEHDNAVAAVSHLPYLLSAGLVTAVKATANGNSAAWVLASSGFRDTSRLAGSDVTMMGDTVLSNREAVLTALKTFGDQIAQMQAALQSDDETKLRALLSDARETRAVWAKSKEQNS